MVLVSQTKVSNGQMHPTVGVGLQTCRGRTVPLRQQVESRHREGQPRLKVDPGTVSHALDVTNGVQHRENGLNHHTRVPLSSLAYQQVGRIALLEGEQSVSQHDHLLLVLSNHWVEGGVMHVSSTTIPIDNQPPLVEQHTQLASHYPLVIGKAFAPHL